MTGLAAFLEDFGTAATDPGESRRFSEADLEGRKLEAFENGYRAGWDDAIQAQSDDRSRISSALGQHLQDLSFTYHEAHAHVMNAMAPLLEDVVRTLLPEMARATLGLHVVDELNRRAQEIGALDVLVAVNPACAQAVAPLLEEGFRFPVRLIEDETLAEEQADIRFGKYERQIDLGTLVASVREAVEGFTYENRRKLAHG